MDNITSFVFWGYQHWFPYCYLCYYAPASTKLKGLYWFHIRLSVPLWTESCPLCIFYNTSWIQFIFIRFINQLQKVCCTLELFLEYKISIFCNFFKFISLTLSCVQVIWILKLMSKANYWVTRGGGWGGLGLGLGVGGVWGGGVGGWGWRGDVWGGGVGAGVGVGGPWLLCSQTFFS